MARHDGRRFAPVDIVAGPGGHRASGEIRPRASLPSFPTLSAAGSKKLSEILKGINLNDIAFSFNSESSESSESSEDSEDSETSENSETSEKSENLDMLGEAAGCGSQSR